MNRQVFKWALSAALVMSVGLLWSALPIQPVRSQTGQLIQCNAAALYGSSASATTLMITAKPNTSIYICGYTLFSAGTVAVQLVRGATSVCGGSPSGPVTPTYEFVAQTVIADSSSVFGGIFVSSDQNVCIVTNAAVSVQAMVFYIQR